MSRRVAALALGGALAATATLGGVVAGPVGASGAGKPESCTILKRKEIAAALGQPASKARTGAVPELCDWALDPTEDRAAGTVHALVVRGRTAERDYRTGAAFHVDDGERVRGLGRKAFFAPSSGTLWVLADRSTLFYVQALYPRDATPDAEVLREGLVRVAERAERRL